MMLCIHVYFFSILVHSLSLCICVWPCPPPRYQCAEYSLFLFSSVQMNISRAFIFLCESRIFFVWCTSVVVPVCKLSFLLLRLVAACYIFIFDCFNTASPAHRGKNTDGKSTEPAIYCCELSLNWILFSSAACTLSLFLSSFFLPSTDTYVCVCVYIFTQLD